MAFTAQATGAQVMAVNGVTRMPEADGMAPNSSSNAASGDARLALVSRPRSFWKREATDKRARYKVRCP